MRLQVLFSRETQINIMSVGLTLTVHLLNTGKEDIFPIKVTILYAHILWIREGSQNALQKPTNFQLLQTLVATKQEELSSLYGAFVILDNNPEIKYEDFRRTS